MILSRVEQAARNNAIWCDTVCRLHGAAGNFLDGVWVNYHRTPAYYPNLITLRSSTIQAAAMEQTRNLIGRGLSGNWAVKDSFQNLDLTAWGFDLLLEASWLWHEYQTHEVPAQTSPIKWTRVTSADELLHWEVVWSQTEGNSGIGGQTRMFPTTLLTDQNVAVLAGYHSGKLIAGGIANSTDAVVGLSNIFNHSSDDSLAWTGLLTALRITFPRRHVVGYEHGRNLQQALACGFEKIGQLCIWLHHA